MDNGTQTSPIEMGNLEKTVQGESLITPELVNEIADKVYAMLALELKIERERRRPAANLSTRGGGGV